MRGLLILIVVLLVAACEPTNIVTRNEGELVLMSYNVRNGKGMDNKRNLNRTAAVIRAAQPDVVALQEIDSVTRRSDKVDVAAYLGRKCSMYHTFSKAIDFDGGGYGVAILSHEKPRSVKRFALPGREEARTLLVVEFKRYIFVSTHLSLTAEDRLASLGVIDSLAKAATKPIFFAGDWNATPDSEFGRALSQTMQYLTDSTQCTFPADNPRTVIDYIVAPRTQLIKVLHREVIDEPIASDHRPIFVKVKF